MRLAKTQRGIEVLKDRSVALSARQRGAFILCDSRHSKAQVLANAQMAGITEADIQCLIDLGLVQEVADEKELAAQRQAEAFHGRTAVDRFKDAYPLAVKLAGSLGLRGFRLSMAVEKSASYEDLCKVAPALKEAVQPEAYQPLDRLLYG